MAYPFYFLNKEIQPYELGGLNERTRKKNIMESNVTLLFLNVVKARKSSKLTSKHNSQLFQTGTFVLWGQSRKKSEV